MKKTLREKMKEEIFRNGWLDYLFHQHKDELKTAAPDKYAAWLDALDDDDFLAAYNRVREAERSLD
jgi:hypothetical protein